MVLRVLLLQVFLFGGGTALRAQPPRTLLEKKVFGPKRRSCSGSTLWRGSESESVIGGTPVYSTDEFPFLALLTDNDGGFCGGSLISDRVVLTAAHCLYPTDAGNAEVYVRVQLTDQSEVGVARGVVNWKQHEDYDDVTVSDDLALLLLNESVDHTATTVHLSDGTGDFESRGNKEIVGWGSSDEGCQTYGSRLRKVDLPMGERGERCSTPGSVVLGPEDDFDYRRQICVGSFEGGRRMPSCGDSGGPLLARDGRAWTQVGIVSWTYGQTFPSVLTRVSYYHHWIKEASEALLKEGRRKGVNFPYW
mmetsp:Transcript_106201/g.317266  ORF Transcript_106201/g.317266 Transcript_106201/m.317266 type:complete len:306 (+) Transcript_106201:39-956(+)